MKKKEKPVKKQTADRGRKEGILGGSVVLLWVLSFVAHYTLAIPLPLKIIGWIIIAMVSVFILAQTQRGKSTVIFLKESKIELQKVVWPTRKEAGQITLIVILVVFFAGLFLWSVDSVMMWCVGKITQLKS